MSGRGFTKRLFRAKLGKAFLTIDKITAVSLIKDNTHWYELYLLVNPHLEINAKFK